MNIVDARSDVQMISKYRWVHERDMKYVDDTLLILVEMSNPTTR
jgi:hypothetical protein